MAEYSKEKLYFLKLPKDFFKSHEIAIIEKYPRGNEMVLFLIKLMCEATPWQGYLRCSEDMPYDNFELSCVMDTDIEIVNTAMRLFKKYKLIHITKNKSIYIPMVEEMTISKTKGAELREQQRERTKSTQGRQKGDKRATNVTQEGDKPTTNVAQDNIDNKIIDSIENKNIVLDKPNTHSINKINKNNVSIDDSQCRAINESVKIAQTSLNEMTDDVAVKDIKKDEPKSSDPKPLENDDDEAIVRIALSLDQMGSNIDLEYFKGRTDLYNEFLKRLENED